jgi:L-fucose/D-arabinose isomerase
MTKIGMIAFSDGRARVHQDLLPDIEKHRRAICARLEIQDEFDLLADYEIVHSNLTAQQVARQAVLDDLDGVIFLIPVFAFPNYVVIVARLLERPLLLLTPQDPSYPGLTGLLAAGGALQQIGIHHQRLWANPDDLNFADEILTFTRAARASVRLKGQVYGLIGGRSIGMATGAAPAEIWMRKFGVDIDHVDQSELVRRAKLVPNEELALAKDWFQAHLRRIVFDNELFTPEKWDFQLGCYIALKDIVQEQHFDFAGIKCHYDMSEFYSVQCISAAFLNDPYDWHGPKKSVPLACEADSDGALTMQIMHLITQKPACLLDLRFFDRHRQVYVMPNCGAAPTWFAAQSDLPEENLAHVSLVPSISKYAGGGAHVQFTFKESDLTLARLTRSEKGYQLVIAYGRTVVLPPAQVPGAVPSWPHAFVSMGVEPSTLVRALQANHLHAVAGNYVRELQLFAQLHEIETVVLNGLEAA